MDVKSSEFTENRANQSSAIEVIQSHRYYNVTIYDCIFESNTALSNTITLVYSNTVVNASEFKTNIAQYKSKNIFAGFSYLYVQDS